jgi:hypothetical protein
MVELVVIRISWFKNEAGMSLCDGASYRILRLEDAEAQAECLPCTRCCLVQRPIIVRRDGLSIHKYTAYKESKETAYICILGYSLTRESGIGHMQRNEKT